VDERVAVSVVEHNVLPVAATRHDVEVAVSGLDPGAARHVLERTGTALGTALVSHARHTVVTLS